MGLPPALPATNATDPDQTYVERAYAHVKSWILDSSFNPGEAISDVEVAIRIGISRTPVREALRQLELEGLVLHTPHKGWRVRVVQPRDIEEIFQVKVALETLLVRQATARLSEDAKAVLARAMEDMEEATARRDVKAWLEADRILARTMFEAADNDRAKGIVASLNIQWHWIWLRFITLEDRMGQSAREHRKILEGMLTGDGEGAARSVEEHLTAVKWYLLNLLTNFVVPLTQGAASTRRRRSSPTSDAGAGRGAGPARPRPRPASGKGP